MGRDPDSPINTRGSYLLTQKQKYYNTIKNGWMIHTHLCVPGRVSNPLDGHNLSSWSVIVGAWKASFYVIVVLLHCFHVFRSCNICDNYVRTYRRISASVLVLVVVSVAYIIVFIEVIVVTEMVQLNDYSKIEYNRRINWIELMPMDVVLLWRGRRDTRWAVFKGQAKALKNSPGVKMIKLDQMAELNFG